jgi:hypothetical protein
MTSGSDSTPMMDSKSFAFLAAFAWGWLLKYALTVPPTSGSRRFFQG